MIESARRNADRAGVSARVTLACRDADAARPPAPTGLVITNPPYGHRLGDPRAAARGYRDLGRVLRAHFRGWRAAVVTPAKLDGERQLGIRAIRTSARFPLRNGGLAIVLHVFDVGLTPARRRRPCPCPVRIRAARPWSRTASGSCPRSSPPRARARRSARRRDGRRAFRGCGEAPGPPPAAARRATAARTPASPTRAAARAHSPPVLRPRRARRPISSECPDR